MIRYGIVGYGRIGQRLAARLPGAVAILKRGRWASTPSSRASLRLPSNVPRRRRWPTHGPSLLAAGIDLVPLSLTALADPDVERRLMAAAKAGPGRLEIAPGAIGTLDLLATAREDGLTAGRLPAIEVARDVAAHAGGSARRPGGDSRPRRSSSGAACARRRGGCPTTSTPRSAWRWPGWGWTRTEAELVADPAISETAHELEIHAAPGTGHADAGRPRGGARRRSGRLHDLQPDAYPASAGRHGW